MLNFADWFLTEERLVINASPGLESHLDKAQAALSAYLNRYSGEEQRAAAARYQYTLENVREGWSEVIYQFRYSPLEKNRRGRDEIASADDYRREYYPSTWDGKTGYRTYPSPKDAIESIPSRPNMGWRGMSWEEWKTSEKRGFIQSMGSYNFSNQQGLTFYGYKPDTALHYASGFAPVAFKTTPTRPGIVIGVPRQALMDHNQDPGIPSGELAHRGPLPLSQVAEVYMLVATRGKSGYLEVVVNSRGKVSEGSRADTSIGYTIRRLR